MLTLTFEPNLEHQTHAINAVVDLFAGQMATDTVNAVEDFNLSQQIDDSNTDLINQQIASQTHANCLLISEHQLLENMQRIQREHGISPSPSLYDDDKNRAKYGINASIEMETGTGKTYVYLRSIYELYHKYGLSKFVIVVPTVAIREGVLKSIEMTRSHFRALYANTPTTANVYDSKNLNVLRDFATNNTLQILVINIDAFAKDENIINQVRERGIAPIEYIQATRPIVIVDEPQNMETKKRLDALASLHPLVTVRYSATHKHTRHLLYSLNPVKAYDAGLVKQIEVDSVMTQDAFNEAYIELIDIIPKKTKITAKVSVYANVKGVVKKKTISISDNDDLYKKTGREIYASGYVVTGLNAGEGYVEFANGSLIKKGQQQGGMTDSVMRYQIERTIEAHLDKQRQLLGQGIKVLSLFFIDRVDNYLVNTETGYERIGKFAKWFEIIYQTLLEKPKYRDLKTQLANLYAEGVCAIHNGYFSVDKKGRAKDTSGTTQADNDTYNLIMKDKEKLLDLANPLQFIFSHSALKEGWDNPNVFQICTLNETKSAIKKRQEIGRGLRLCVGSDGHRVYNKQVNVLTVIANESYEDFAKSLQNEISEDYDIDFGHRAKNKADKREIKYRKGFALDENFKAIWDLIKHKTQYQVNFDGDELIDQVASAIKNMEAINPPQIQATKQRLLISDEGIEGRLMAVNSPKSAYQVDHKQKQGNQPDSQCSNHSNSQANTLTNSQASTHPTSHLHLPDVLSYLVGHTKLTRHSLLQILRQSGRLEDLLINPQIFLDRVVAIVKQVQTSLMVEGIAYQKNGQYYTQNLLERLEADSTFVYVDPDSRDHHFEVTNSDKTIFEHLIPLDSHTEYQFAKDCESMASVLFYFKLPNWFKINTPVGTYNPDWAVVTEDDSDDAKGNGNGNTIGQLYFVAETKNTGGQSASGQPVDIAKLPMPQQQRIKCGHAHFKALNMASDGGQVRFKVVEKVGQLVK